jgi:hypothetical protein
MQNKYIGILKKIVFFILSLKKINILAFRKNKIPYLRVLPKKYPK